MEIKETLVLDSSEPLSKALGGIMDTGTAVIITKSGRYYGIIDDRSVRLVGDNPLKVKCETVVVKPPVISPESSIWERADAFLLGRFKALPVVDEKEKPLGVITRVEVLKELKSLGILPKLSVTNIMKSPVYTIEERERVGEAKRRMKEYGTKRLIVTRNGVPVGVFSTLDLAGVALKPTKKEKMPVVLPERTSIDDRQVMLFYRPDIVTVDEKSSVDEAAQKMIEKEVSHVVILANKKPVGVISAIDIFRWIKEETKEEIPIEISGLDDDTRIHYNYIKKEVAEVATKFAKSFGILGVAVHVKRIKSFFSVKIHVNGDERFVVASEGPSIEDTVNEAVSELKKILSRKKGREKSRKSIKRKGIIEYRAEGE
ncbi:MAG: CBS domain-containing protein [Candidatus Bilamarchaeaceae archaeon]